MAEMPNVIMQLDELLPQIERLKRIEAAAEAVLKAWEADTWTQGDIYVEEMRDLREALAE